MLKKIKIEKLFNTFDYEINFNEKGLTILTGPNGYGKTTILNIINSLYKNNLYYFFRLPFKKLEVEFDEVKIEINKSEKNTIEMKTNNENSFIFNEKDINREFKKIARDLSYRQVEENRWINRNGIVYSKENLIEELTTKDLDLNIVYKKGNIPKTNKVYLIKEQRLIGKTLEKRRDIHYYRDESNENFNITVEKYSKELSKNLKEILAKASKIGQELDSSFPRRLFEEINSISEDDFNKRYNKIKEKQKLLKIYGLSSIEEGNQANYKLENSKALFVYLNDTESKLIIFDEILKKLKIFSNILEKRKFAYKTIQIDPEIGFKFISKDEDRNEILLSDLSSGEQQELILLYELLFKAEPNTIVLIDEPEISLHVSWQKEFLNDLQQIVELQQIEVIIATHSPQIINGNWDLTVDLFDLVEGKKDE